MVLYWDRESDIPVPPTNDRWPAVLVWVFFSLLGVVSVKYYTSMEMRKLERRLDTVKEDLRRAKAKFESAQRENEEIVAEEELCTERIRAMKDMMQDLNVRLIAAERPEEELVEERVR